MLRETTQSAAGSQGDCLHENAGNFAATKLTTIPRLPGPATPRTRFAPSPVVDAWTLSILRSAARAHCTYPVPSTPTIAMKGVLSGVPSTVVYLPPFDVADGDEARVS